MRDEPAVDLVVAGAGGGLVAALRAAEQGLSVLVVEADEHFRRGNNTYMSTGMIPAAGTRWQREAGVEDSAQGFVADVMAKTGGQAEPALTAALADCAPVLVEWLADHVGLPIELATDFLYPGHSAHRCHTVPGRSGTGLLDPLTRKAAAADRIDMLVPASLTDVSTDGTGSVRAAVVEFPDGTREEIPCRAVLLATNGFGADRELVRELLPAIADAVYHGGERSAGDALRIGTGLGAAVGYLDAYQGHAGLSSGGSLLTWASVMHGAVLVNTGGRRFGDETTGYSEYAEAVVAQPGGTAWLVYDQRIHEACLPFQDYLDVVEGGGVRRADTVPGLAELTGLPVGELTRTLGEAARAAGGEGHDPFGRTLWEAPLEAPYSAVRVRGALFHTQGGLMVDGHGRVLREDGTPIPGLYASGGAAIGISGHGAGGYLAGNGLLPAFGLAYLAADHLRTVTERT
ncbi:FAD-binding protein [Streptomyces sp. NBC_01754]|uniref:FAD-dependent oxidoreductase n=1 Tax=Streptomyces sp. NBC_01754 TaxID=2975930 RepID=UPI002DD90265|nr:FAD-binding protein [Streptomyces sp. NBC_01754]WSC91819.1 FAD-binding protein [Streptomyces sp. NBC_01754]